jgi:Zn-dependent peptidase ImmA (M78 family)
MPNIEEKVVELLKRKNVRRPPVPVEKIARALGLEISFAPLNADLSGAILRSRDGVVIGVNSSHHPNRQRFTIAHEIGHFLLHKGMNVHWDTDFRVNWRDGESSEGVNREEMQANRFAAELLMPASFVMTDIEKVSDLNKETIRRLARRYKVSSQAMEIKLGNLGFVLPV